MKQDETYNGWTNYETWLAGLWLDNDPDRYKSIVNKVRFVDETDTDEVENFQDYLKAAITYMIHSGETMGDILESYLPKINFVELASHWLEEDYS